MDGRREEEDEDGGCHAGEGEEHGAAVAVALADEAVEEEAEDFAGAGAVGSSGVLVRACARG